MSNNNNNNGGARKEKMRKKYWCNIIDVGISMSFSFTTLLIGFQNKSEGAQRTVADMALTTGFGLVCYFGSMFFGPGSVPNAILASLGACSNAMVFCFMVMYVHWPSSPYYSILEIVSCVVTLLIIISVSRASIRAVLGEWSVKLVNSGWKRCGGFVATVVTFFDHHWALVSGCFCGFFGDVTGYVLDHWADFKVYVRSRLARVTSYVLGRLARVPSYVRGLFRDANRTRAEEEEVELARLDRDV